MHAIGLPALSQLQSTHGWFATGGDVVIRGVAVEVPAQTAHFVLQPGPHGDAQGVEAVVPYLYFLGGVDDQESL